MLHTPILCMKRMQFCRLLFPALGKKSWTLTNNNSLESKAIVGLFEAISRSFQVHIRSIFGLHSVHIRSIFCPYSVHFLSIFCPYLIHVLKNLHGSLEYSRNLFVSCFCVNIFDGILAYSFHIRSIFVPFGLFSVQFRSIFGLIFLPFSVHFRSIFGPSSVHFRSILV